MRANEVRFLSERIAASVGLDTLQLIGSQSLHAYMSDAPDVVLLSLEADYLLSEDAPSILADRIKREFGSGSVFQAEHGFHADVVRENFACLPPRWQERVRVERLVGHSLALCSLEPHDLAISKLYVDREKDIEFLAFALDRKLISLATLEERTAEFGDDLERQAKLRGRLRMLPSKVAALRAEQEEEQRMQSYNAEPDANGLTTEPPSL